MKETRELNALRNIISLFGIRAELKRGNKGLLSVYQSTDDK
ncbi:hypothetical protein [Nitrosomonas sp.]|nr:hypothetical protein [Nitrosomonas sp.]